MTSAFLRFVVVGVVGFAVDAGGTWLLMRAGLQPLAARIGPLLAAVVCTWALNRSLTFRVARARSKTEFLRYVGVAASAAALNYLLYGGLVLLGVHAVVAVATATMVLMFYSFFAYRRWVFR